MNIEATMDHRVGRALAGALVTGVVAALAWWVIVVWSVPPLTLEGAWLYPLAALATATAMLAARSLLHTTDRA